jgi:hypothetical protein
MLAITIIERKKRLVSGSLRGVRSFPPYRFGVLFAVSSAPADHRIPQFFQQERQFADASSTPLNSGLMAGGAPTLVAVRL